MTRCMSCNGILKSEEKTCYGCGEPVPPPAVGPSLSQRFATVMTVVFLGSALLTGASLFFSDYTPPFTVCFIATIILLFVKRSADQISEGRSVKP